MSGPERLRFGVFELDVAARELRSSGRRVKLQDQPFELLVLLARRPGEVVSRDDVRRALWPADTFVDFDHSLGTAVGKLRSALGDTARNPRFIETIANRGYKFVAPVEVMHPRLQPLPVAAPVTAEARPPTPAAADSAVRESWTFRARLAAVIFGLLAGAALVALVLEFDLFSAGDWLRRYTNPPIGSLAVLPFRNLSQDQSQAYFVDGVTEALTTSLGQLQGVRVISRNSSAQYRDTTKSAPVIGRDLHVDALVVGAVFRNGRRVRVSAQLVDARTDSHLWARSYERDLGDVLTLQSELAQAIADEIRAKLSTSRASSARVHRVVPDAQDAYLRGRYHLNQGDEAGIRRSIDEFTSATTLDATDARSFAGLAESLIAMTDYYEAPSSTMPRAREAARRAAELDPELSEAHAALGAVRFLYDWDWAGAEHELTLATSLAQGSSDAHLWYGVFLAQMARFPEAIAEVKAAETLDPLSVGVHLNAGWVFYLARRNADAIQHWRRALEIAPDIGAVHTSIWAGYAQSQADSNVLTATPNLSDSSPMNLATLAGAFAVTGHRTDAEAMLTRLEGLSRTHYVCPYELATAHAALGEREVALDLLRKAVAERSICVPDMKTDPRLDPLRADPRFDRLVRDVGLQR